MAEELEKFITVNGLDAIQGCYYTKKYSKKDHYVDMVNNSSVFSIEHILNVEESETVFVGDLKNFYITIE